MAAAVHQKSNRACGGGRMACLPPPFAALCSIMLGLGLGEIIVLGFILLVVFSAARMGQLGNAVGKFVYSFRKASRGEDLVDAKPLPPGRRSTTDAEFTEPEQPRRR
ncbi:hypothetical protein BHS07_29625 [Myxococcus xanthus]|nr:hypothetical protein [Myxococcus xanthus]NOK06556.1 hypothetical protein [Myxococcus xanthus]QDE70694.1 hypothetical protein BHS09_29060 [Myxococcus xanthus]QDE77973.1 hypothetical protein BHS08_29080 [Myxococcus xanthus]QDE85355.1 hypothetical protein BHS07_29625 [Myxococcus xanthus]